MNVQQTVSENNRVVFFSIILYCITFIGYILIPAIREPNNIGAFLTLVTLHSIVGYIVWVKIRHQTLTLPLLLLLFLVPRLIIVPMLPWLSDDVYGYLWYGRLAVHGMNPFIDGADSPLFSHLRNSSYDLLAYKQFPAIYPPLAEVFMALGVGIGELFSKEWFTAFMGWKVVLFIGELIAFFILIRKRNVESDSLRKGIILFLLSPLPVIEIIGQGHNDGLLLPFIAIMIIILNNRKEWSLSKVIYLGVLIGCMTSIKVYPIVLILPLLLYRSVSIRHKAILCTSFVVTVVALALPFFYDYHALNNFVEILKFYNLTSFNSPPLLFMREIAQILGSEKWWELAPKLVTIARVSSIGIIGVLFYRMLKKNQNIDTINALLFVQFMMLLAFTLISPKVHTWYFVPLLFLNCIVFSRSVAFVLPLQLFSYSLYLLAIPKELFYLEWLVWGIFIVAFILEFPYLKTRLIQKHIG